MVSNADKKNAMLYILLMLLAGCMIAMQSPINAALSRTVGVLESSLISFAVGTLFLALAVLFFGRGNGSAAFWARSWCSTPLSPCRASAC